MASTTRNNNVLIVGGLAAAATISLFVWYLNQPSSRKEKALASDDGKKKSGSGGGGKTTIASRGFAIDTVTETPPISQNNSLHSYNEEEQTPLVENRHKVSKQSPSSSFSPSKQEERSLHARIEELDKKGKALFKNKMFLEAAETFTEALDLIAEYDNSTGEPASSSSLSRQLITLLNNRSAMYEKASMPELALDDCGSILDLEANHGKARTRKLRILEALQRWYECLVEICAMQLQFMQANRTNLRMGLPTPPPPVPQSKMEQVLAHVVPEQVQEYTTTLQLGDGKNNSRPPPSSYTILQLLKSYTNYHKWMAEAAKDGAIATMAPVPDGSDDKVKMADRAVALLKRGRRHVYEGNYAAAMADFEDGHGVLQKDAVGALMPDDSHARLLEWAGMARHWQYRLDAALDCYEACVDLEPNNPLILVKQAGVCMDSAGGSLQDKALELFQLALEMDSTCADALLHRSNLYMIQSKPELAKEDLQKCVQHHPNHVMARLRLASILAATQDAAGAQQQLDVAERVEPNSSEVQSYRGELHFTQGQMDEARTQFEKAMKLEPNNPTPYVNAAMAILNTPPAGPGQTVDAAAAIGLLEKALEVDPQFMAAYVQLGQLKLGTATELTSARQVIDLYDTALQHCRTVEDLRELCSMRILAVAQVEAATMLKMETFNLQ